jgi:uncharacterized protein YjbJ (UPF0337 family)
MRTKNDGRDLPAAPGRIRALSSHPDHPHSSSEDQTVTYTPVPAGINPSFNPLADNDCDTLWVYSSGVYLEFPSEQPKGRGTMNWDRIEGQWKQRRGKAMHHWGKVMNDELAAMAGKYEDLVGRLQERYGIAKERAQLQVDKINKTVKELKKSNSRLVRLQKSLRNKPKPVKAPVRKGRPRKESLRSKPRG